MSEEREERCGNCRFWKKPVEDEHGYSHGQCKRFPTSGTPAAGTYVSAGDWCGEFEDALATDDEVTGEEIHAVVKLVQAGLDSRKGDVWHLSLSEADRKPLVSFLGKVAL